MVRSSVSKSSSKLNLSRRQTDLFQRIILVGNQMAKAMRPRHQLPAPDREKLKRKWDDLTVELAHALL